MAFASSVQAGPDLSNLGPSSSARVTVIGRDPFGVFARAAAREHVRRLTIISPWLAVDGGDRPVSFRELVTRVDRRGGSVVLVTRTPSSETHAAAIDLVDATARGTVHINDGLHAKLFVCEVRDRGGFAVIGSANASAGSSGLAELALLVRPTQGSRTVKHLAGAAVRGLLSTKPVRP